MRGFRFIVLTHPHTYPHRDKLVAISAPPYYVVDADNNKKKPKSRRNPKSTVLSKQLLFLHITNAHARKVLGPNQITTGST